MIAWFIRFFTGVQSRWVGCEPQIKQRIYFANHGSNLDGPTIWASLPRAVRQQCRMIAARDYWQANPWRRYLSQKIFNAILINRKNITREDNPLDQMFAALEGTEDSMIIFPEGTRKDPDDEDDLNNFKAGLYRLALQFPNIELIPVYIRNLNRILPKGEYLPVPVLSSVSFGTALEIIADEDKNDFLKRAQQAIIDLKEHEDR